MKYYNWNAEKNVALKRERNVSFEEVVYHIKNDDEVDIYDHPNQERYPNQKISVVIIEDYAYLVPFIESEREIFLKTIIPNRKATKSILETTKMYKLDEEEREIVEAFEQGELKSIPDKDVELKKHRAYVAATFKKDKRLNIRISNRDLNALQKKALSEGIPYHTLVTSILHKYINGRLVEKEELTK